MEKFEDKKELLDQKEKLKASIAMLDAKTMQLMQLEKKQCRGATRRSRGIEEVNDDADGGDTGTRGPVRLGAGAGRLA